MCAFKCSNSLYCFIRDINTSIVLKIELLIFCVQLVKYIVKQKQIVYFTLKFCISMNDYVFFFLSHRYFSVQDWNIYLYSLNLGAFERDEINWNKIKKQMNAYNWHSLFCMSAPAIKLMIHLLTLILCIMTSTKKHFFLKL